MDRRGFVGGLAAAAAASSSLARTVSAQPAPAARNVVLVHGLFADGSCWTDVIARLQPAGLTVTAVQNPLTTLEESVAATLRVLARQDGPTVLVGHSFAGMILSEAGVDPKVTALVYVAARAPDAGEDYTALAARYPTPPASAGVIWSDDWGQLSEAAFLRDFAGDLPRTRARALYAVQAPFKHRPGQRPDHSGGLARQAQLLCRVDGGSDDQSGSGAVHGQAHGRQDDRGEIEPPVADLPARHDRQTDPGGDGPRDVANGEGSTSEAFASVVFGGAAEPFTQIAKYSRADDPWSMASRHLWPL